MITIVLLFWVFTTKPKILGIYRIVPNLCGNYKISPYVLNNSYIIFYVHFILYKLYYASSYTMTVSFARRSFVGWFPISQTPKKVKNNGNVRVMTVNQVAYDYHKKAIGEKKRILWKQNWSFLELIKKNSVKHPHMAPKNCYKKLHIL